MKSYTLLLLVLLLGCKSERPFEWSSDIEKLTNKDLKSWLEKSPFDGAWNEVNTDKKSIKIDNRKQVFPFMGKFKNEHDNFKDYGNSTGDIFQKEIILFKDSNFGESFVYASLMYEPNELFIDNFYSETGSIFLSGQNAINESYIARLSETLVFERNSKYKTVIYWVMSNYKTYLFGFYQQKNLLFQFGFPCEIESQKQGISRIKEINNSLHLNIKEWAALKEESLAINKNPQSFWVNPYVGIYLGKYMLSDVRIKIKNTEFKELKSKLSLEKGVDYIFAYEKLGKKHMISFKRVKTSLKKEEYNNQQKEKNYKIISAIRDREIFITREEVINGQVIVDTETYFKDNSYLKIQISYPDKDVVAKDKLFDILKYLKIHSF